LRRQHRQAIRAARRSETRSSQQAALLASTRGDLREATRSLQQANHRLKEVVDGLRTRDSLRAAARFNRITSNVAGTLGLVAGALTAGVALHATSVDAPGIGHLMGFLGSGGVAAVLFRNAAELALVASQQGESANDADERLQRVAQEAGTPLK